MLKTSRPDPRSASRASILRGQYAHNTNIVGNEPPWGGYETFHGLFGFNIAECVSRGVAPGKCNAFRQWLTSSALAFLDAHVRNSNLAKAWLVGGFVQQASAGVVEWKSK